MEGEEGEECDVGEEGEEWDVGKESIIKRNKRIVSEITIFLLRKKSTYIYFYKFYFYNYILIFFYRYVLFV